MIRSLARAARRLFAPLVHHFRNFLNCNRSVWRIALAEMEADCPPG